MSSLRAAIGPSRKGSIADWLRLTVIGWEKLYSNSSPSWAPDAPSTVDLVSSAPSLLWNALGAIKLFAIKLFVMGAGGGAAPAPPEPPTTPATAADASA